MKTKLHQLPPFSFRLPPDLRHSFLKKADSLFPRVSIGKILRAIISHYTSLPDSEIKSIVISNFDQEIRLNPSRLKYKL